MECNGEHSILFKNCVMEKQPTPVLFHGESQGQGSLGGYSPWGHKELDLSEATEHERTM